MNELAKAKAFKVVAKGGREYYTATRQTRDAFGDKEIAKSRKVKEWGYILPTGETVYGFETKKRAKKAAEEARKRFTNTTGNEMNELAKAKIREILHKTFSEEYIAEAPLSPMLDTKDVRTKAFKKDIERHL